MKILLIHNRYRHPGGEDQVFRREAELLSSAGHKLLEYTRDNAEIEDGGILNKAHLAARTLWAWDSQRELRAILKAEKPDVAHFHNTFPLISPAAYHACWEFRVPVVQTLHNTRLLCPGGSSYRDGRICEECLGRIVPWPGVVHACYRGSLAQSAVVAGMLSLHRLAGTWRTKVGAYIVSTKFFRKKFIEAGLLPGRIFLKPHFVYADPELKPQRRSDYALFAGRLAAEKGIGTLLDAWKLLRRSIPLRIAGDGPDRKVLEAAAKEAGLSNILFEGWMSPEQLRGAMERAAFLIFPSQSSETFGLPIIEAFACGVPVIASRLGATMEIVESGKTGLHFHPGDAADLALKAEWLWTHKNEAEAMGRAARGEYEAKYTPERNYELLMNIYAAAFNQRACEAA